MKVLFGEERADVALAQPIELRLQSLGRGHPQDLLLETLPNMPAVAGGLGGYLLMRMGNAAELRVPATNLVKYFPDLPDAHLLFAAYLEHEQALGDARVKYLEALERGVPSIAMASLCSKVPSSGTPYSTRERRWSPSCRAVVRSTPMASRTQRSLVAQRGAFGIGHTR